MENVEGGAEVSLTYFFFEDAEVGPIYTQEKDVFVWRERT